MLVQPVQACGALEAPLAHLVQLGCRWQWLSGRLGRGFTDEFQSRPSHGTLQNWIWLSEQQKIHPKSQTPPHPPNGDGFGTSTVTLLQLFQSCKHSSSHLLKPWRPSPKVLGWGSFTDRLRRRCRTSVLQRGHWQGYVSDSETWCYRCFCLLESLFGVHLWFWRILGNSC